MTSEKKLPMILTSSQVIRIIPSGTTFTAIYAEKKEDVVASEDMIVMSKGYYIDSVDKANSKYLKEAKKTNINSKILSMGTVVLGIIGSLLTILITKKKSGA